MTSGNGYPARRRLFLARRSCLELGLALALVFAFVPCAAAAPFDTTLVSRATGANGAKGDAASTGGSISADGRYVAFVSLAQLRADDTDAAKDVYVRDMQAGITTLVSRATGASGAKGNADSGSPQRVSISADGRYVAFQSSASNLHPDDADFGEDVYVRDLVAHTTMLVSRASGANGAKSNTVDRQLGYHEGPSISADGRYVTFESHATNLHPDDPDLTTDIFVRDVVSNTTTLASRASGASGVKGNAISFWPSISADGRYVVFSSRASNIHPDDLLIDASSDVYVRDLAANTTTLISRATGANGLKGTNHSGISGVSSVSGNGRYVAFHSEASLHPDDTDRPRPDVVPGQLEDFSDVYVRDVVASTTTLVSRASGASGAHHGGAGSASPFISADGRYVSFISTANLDPDDDPNSLQDVFVRDLAANVTTLVHRASGENGARANYLSRQDTSALSADGRFVTFQSEATNLHPDDTDGTPDVFRRDLGPPLGFPVANLSFAKSDSPDPVRVGEALTYTLSATNVGPDVAQGVSVRDELPAGVEFVSASDGCTQSGGAVTCGLAELAVGASAERQVVVRPTQANPSLSNTAAVQSATVDPDPADNSGVASTEVRPALGPPGGGSEPGLGPGPSSAPAGGSAPAGSSAPAGGSAPGLGSIPPAILTPGPCSNERRGTEGQDTLNGTAAGDRLLGMGGNDTLNGLQDEDCLFGGAGVDRLSGAEGDDQLSGDEGNDVLGGSQDDDLLRGGAGHDRLTGDKGADRLEGGPGNDRLDGGPGAPRGRGGNTYLGGAGNDNINAANGRRERIHCGTGRDRVRADRSDRLRGCELVHRAQVTQRRVKR